MGPDITQALTNAQNIVLVGMPGSGKSTIGVLLAKRLGYAFLDTDIYIQSQEGEHLFEIIRRLGRDGFCQLEEEYLLSVACHQHVIATGGSAVYGAAAMKHLHRNGVIVYLDLDPERLSARLANLDARGVVRSPGQSIAALHRERAPLYLQHADIRIVCGSATPEQIVRKIMSAVNAA
jgi:shikimate kinase